METFTQSLISPEPPPTQPERHTRIDAPHVSEHQRPPSSREASAAEEEQAASNSVDDGLLEVVEEPSPEMLAAVQGECLDLQREQLELEIGELAEHLRQRLRELDRREMQLNARSAQLDAEVRASRIWLNEREMEFQQRESELRRRIEQLEEEVSKRWIDEHAHVAQEVELRIRQEMEGQWARRVQMREESLRSTEAQLAERARQLDQDRRDLAAQQQAWQAQQTHERQALVEEVQRAQAELAAARQHLQAREQWIERESAAVHRLRAEAVELHREALEMRLAAEQLWSQICGPMTAVEASHCLAKLRQKLSEHYRLEAEALHSSRQQLLDLGERIAASHRELVQLRTGLREWAAARQAEFERQTAVRRLPEERETSCVPPRVAPPAERERAAADRPVAT